MPNTTAIIQSASALETRVDLVEAFFHGQGLQFAGTSQVIATTATSMTIRDETGFTVEVNGIVNEGRIQFTSFVLFAGDGLRTATVEFAGVLPLAVFNADAVIDEVLATFDKLDLGNRMNVQFEGGVGADVAQGSRFDDAMRGGLGDDRLVGRFGNDYLWGGSGNDFLSGWSGDDHLFGGLGRDYLSGSIGADTFHFTTATEMPGDTIAGFSRLEGDKINLKAVDANEGLALDQTFVFLGSGAFTKQAGELRVRAGTDSVTIQGDVNGDGVADFNLLVRGVTSLGAVDFVL